MGSFKDVVGHKDIINYIRNAVSEDKVSHAYILNGERGSGKKMLANLFASTLQCEKGGPDPCNECHSCKQAESGNHPDIIHVTHEKPNTISVEDVRTQVNNDIMIKPYQGPYKIYIISEADLMTPQAQNALLKTIEEPPEYAVIFLLTENAQMLLPTITSRCVMLKLRNIKDTLIKKYLMETVKVPDYKADMCTAFAQGNMGRAIMLANSEHFNEIREEAVQLLKYIDEMDLNEVVKAIKRISAYKLEINDYLDIIMIWYRDVLLYKATGDERKITFQDEKMIIKRQASECSYHGLNTIIQAENTARRRIACNGNYNLAVELMLLSIKENIA